ncbi:TRAP-type transporter, periplasmic component, putative [Alloalcanivorax dieselolei B5]|uniref:TRAP-type transporter, periplasmic component, putative n=1 Tax=Alcanivorax dieselolei (strain DSM 16502 / CGMCC 1.3690 / MCCC 1A00001 / B-5) TaxID=930169 RepID=K0CFN7_ALCDB|nr:TAXI family TRAP transporter solute-binding subunit [Alloalcanivorax dieselolei]AFT71160.1 TRAP-type transporter, periplasmic component, putative [Alloalcanivorax dieselolei B5]GGJ93556.1 C4-dicarboxylate ABC transporter substrate-binding protein [Alloalcanivorax dieselolei]
MFGLRTIKRAACVLTATLALGQAAQAQESHLRMQTATPGSGYYVFSVTLQSILQKKLPVKINMTAGVTGPRSPLDAARGQTDLFISSPSINHFMRTGTGMFAKMKTAPELYKNVRQIMTFPAGPYHIVVHEKSGIRSLEDIKGRRIFLGAPGGAATLVAISIVEGATGYKAGQDYELAKLDWNSGLQAFQDGHVDMLVMPTQLPSASMEQMALLEKVRFLGIPDAAFESDQMKEIMALPGRTQATIPAGIYGGNQTNETDVRTIGSWAGLGTRKDLDEELVYQIIKTLFENLDAFHSAAKFMEEITLENALTEMRTPLHAGAVRYYREAGVDLPDHLIPPEAR